MVAQKEEKVLLKRRVLYIGSSVPLETASGIEAIQQPLRDRYPCGDESKIQGIDAYVSITTSGLALQYVEDSGVVIHFPISSLSLCAGVRHVKTINGSTGEVSSRFISLSSPQAKDINARSPAIFTAITRRTKGRKVLECHGFLCANDTDAVDLVRATSAVDKSSRNQGSVRTHITEEQTKVIDPRLSSFRSTNGTEHANKMSFKSANGAVPNGTPVGITTNGHAPQAADVRLRPGNTMPKAATEAPKEFYEAPPPQGYFYSSSKTEVKQYNIEKDGPPEIPRPRTPSPKPSITERAPTVVSAPAGYVSRPPPHFMRRPATVFVRGPPPPPPHPMARRPVYGPPPPPQPVRIVGPPPIRRRFFSPPPPPPPRVVPPPPPPPFMVPPPPHMMPPPPIFVRRHRRHRSGSAGSNSLSSRESSPRNFNGDANSESDFGRPPTPPRDYEPAFRGERLSRRDDFERKKRGKSKGRRPSPHKMMYDGLPGNPYYVYAPPPGYPHYMPFPVRSRSVPPHTRYATEDPRRGKKGRGKKGKKHRYNSDESTDGDNYRFSNNYDNLRKPRDFRREENQFLNEKSFSRRIQEESRKSEGVKENHPTAYELNAPESGRRDDNDQFLLY